MAASSNNHSQEVVLQRLLEHARAKWGEARAREIRATLENTATQLVQVSNNLPDKETEPGFYQ